MKTAKTERRRSHVVLRAKGKAAAVVQDASAHQRLLDLAARAHAKEGIRQGIEDSNKGKVRSAREFFDEFEARHRSRN